MHYGEIPAERQCQCLRRRAAARALPVLRLRLQDDHARAPRRQPAAAAVGERQPDSSTRSACPTRVSTATSSRFCRSSPSCSAARTAAPARAPVPLITNVMGASAEELSSCSRLRRTGADHRGRAQRVVPQRADRARPRRRPRALEASSRRAPATGKPLIVKLTPNTADVGACALGAEAGGADAVSLINTLRAMALAPRAGATRRRRGGGGRAVARRRNRRAVRSRGPRRRARPGRRRRRNREYSRDRHGRRAERSPRADLLDVGATLVAVGTESFRDPAAVPGSHADCSRSCPHLSSDRGMRAPSARRGPAGSSAPVQRPKRGCVRC